MSEVKKRFVIDENDPHLIFDNATKQLLNLTDAIELLNRFADIPEADWKEDGDRNE
jgi:hypothetical protein